MLRKLLALKSRRPNLEVRTDLSPPQISKDLKKLKKFITMKLSLFVTWLVTVASGFM
jgi:hypothetical protein